VSDYLRPRDVVRLRTELTRSFSRPDMRQGLEGWLAHRRRTDPDPDTVSWTAEVVVDALGRSALYLVAGEMIDLVNHASATLPDYRLHWDDAPAPEGLCCFAKPIRVDDFRYAAFSWFRLSHRSRDRGVGLVWWFRPQDHEYYNPRGGYGAPLLPVRHYVQYVDEHWQRTDHGADAGGTDLPSWNAALWRLVGEEWVDIAHRIPETTRRGVPRANPEVDTVRVVTLRQPPSEPGRSTGGSVDSSHRWWVTYHWRQQWYPSQGRHAPRWI
jgi:hypothetical protein